MREYELVYIINPTTDSDKLTELNERLKNIITSEGGELIDLKPWGKRELAYEIKGQTEGNYILVDFKGDTKVMQELERVLKITSEVLRYTIVKK